MEAVKKISEKLKDYTVREDDLKIDQWHLTFGEGQAMSLGLDSNEVGGPYVPLSKREGYGGSVYIRWADGKVSDASITSVSLEDLDSALKEWRWTSYYDEDAPDVIDPLPIPDNLNLKNDKIVDIITKDSPYFFEILEFYKKKLGKKDYIKMIDGEVSANYSSNVIINSKGFNAAWEETSMSVGIYVNSIIGDGYTKRTLPEKKDLNSILKELDQYVVHSKDIMPVKDGEMPIIFTPSVLGELFGAYVTRNILNGSSVAHNQTLYSIEDFKLKRQVFDERINLIVDGLKEHATSTQPCSKEGVPSTKQYLIADGRLITPMLDRKYAKKTGMQPTSIGEIDLEVEPKISYKSMKQGIDYGIIVYGILGGHTLDTTTGKYSTTVDQGLLIESGKIKGKIKAVSIDGNFFEDLKNKNTKFAEYRKDELAMMTKAKITP
jgi:PmbA protein